MSVILEVTGETQDMTIIQIYTTDGHHIKDVKVETNLVNGISLFNDLLTCSNQDKIIPFPCQYNEVAMLYIGFY